MTKLNLIIVLSIAISNLNAFALNITNSVPGELKTLVTDKTVTELSVSGQIDARDIKFISEEMLAVKQLNLADVDIIAFNGMIPFLGDKLEYKENSLPEYCFFAKEYESVKLPSTLKSIDTGAFAGCKKLVDVTLPDGLESINDYAFSSCVSLSKLSLPMSLKKIGNGAFSRCETLTDVSLETLSAECLMGENLFANCTSLKRAVLGNQIINLPSGIFAGCTALTIVEVGENPSLEKVGERAFDSTAITMFAFDSCNAIKDIGDWAFGNSELKEINLPESIVNLGQGAFFYNKQLEKFAIPNKVSKLNDFVFAGTEALNNSLIVSDNTTEIGRYAFTDAGVTTITLPSTIDYLGDYAFANNLNMTEMVVCATDVPGLGENVFSGINQSGIVLKVPFESVEAYKSAEQWKEFNIAGDMSTLEEAVEIGDCLKIHFIDDYLHVIASEKIQHIEVYEPSGIMITSHYPHKEYTTINLARASATVYIVVVQLESGITKTKKLIK